MVNENGVFETAQLSGFLDADVVESLVKLKVLKVTNSGATYYFLVGTTWRVIVLPAVNSFRYSIRQAAVDYLALYEVK